MWTPCSIILALLLSLSVACGKVDLYPHHHSIARARQPRRAHACSVDCADLFSAKSSCNTPHCACAPTFLHAQAKCNLCKAHTPDDQAAVQFLIDAETNQCQSEGIEVEFQVQLPPAAAAIVHTYDVQSQQLRREQAAFLALQVSGGHVGLVVLLLFGLFRRRVHRDATYFNFCITWIFSSIVFSLMLYRGTQGNTLTNSLGEVPPEKCLVQAAVASGAQVMTACSTMALVIQLWLGLRPVLQDESWVPKTSRWATGSLLAMPYIFFLAFTLPAIFAGEKTITVQDQILERAIPTNFYCMLAEEGLYFSALYGVTLGLLVLTLIFDGLLISFLYRNWRAFRYSEVKSHISLSILLRVMGFSLYRVVVAVAYIAGLMNPPATTDSLGMGPTLAVTFGLPVWIDMLQATIPLVAFLVLGLNRDILRTLIFWRGGQ